MASISAPRFKETLHTLNSSKASWSERFKCVDLILSDECLLPKREHVLWEWITTWPFRR